MTARKSATTLAARAAIAAYAAARAAAAAAHDEWRAAYAAHVAAHGERAAMPPTLIALAERVNCFYAERYDAALAAAASVGDGANEADIR